jgi:ubiquinone/menaquinone biosynthesis C-methylase UbiE
LKREDIYFDIAYDKKGRFASYWHQIHEIVSLRPTRILEIGVGNKFVTGYLLPRGLRIVTFDINKKLFPDVCGSILACPLKSNSFDLVSCCEVLEHLPYNVFSGALEELHRLTTKHVLLSVPDSSSMYRFWIQIPKIGEIQRLIRFPFKRELPHIYDGHHYWHIGRQGYSLDRIRRDMDASGFEILKTYRVFEFYHRFFVLRKKGAI